MARGADGRESGDVNGTNFLFSFPYFLMRWDMLLILRVSWSAMYEAKEVYVV